MYIPSAFEEHDSAKLFTLIERYSFGLLISRHGDEPFATPLPFLVDRAAGPQGALVGHMARANPQWQQAEGQTVLAAFSGPHAYISPTWYEGNNVVPTWNYVAVHVYGTFHAIHDEAELMRIVNDTVGVYEAEMPVPWTMESQAEYNEKLIKGIVGFRIEISRLEGKLKLNQNQSAVRREKVARALGATGEQNAVEIATMMK
jgi:transcriptional regulator